MWNPPVSGRAVVRLFKRPFERNGADFTRDRRDSEIFRPRNGKA